MEGEPEAPRFPHSMQTHVRTRGIWPSPYPGEAAIRLFPAMFVAAHVLAQEVGGHRLLDEYSGRERNVRHDDADSKSATVPRFILSPSSPPDVEEPAGLSIRMLVAP